MSVTKSLGTKNGTRSIPAFPCKTIQHNFKDFSVLVYFLKSQSMILRKISYLRKITRFLLAELSNKSLISTLGCNVKNMCIHIYAQHMCLYILCICHFTALTTVGGNLCRFPRHIPPLFSPENDSSCHG